MELLNILNKMSFHCLLVTRHCLSWYGFYLSNPIMSLQDIIFKLFTFYISLYLQDSDLKCILQVSNVRPGKDTSRKSDGDNIKTKGDMMRVITMTNEIIEGNATNFFLFSRSN